MTAIHRDTPEYDLHVRFANLTLELSRIHDEDGFTEKHERANHIQWELDQISRDLKKTNDYGFTEREIQVLQLLAHGHSNESAGEILLISPETVRTHIRKSMARMGAKTRVQAVAVAARLDMFDMNVPQPTGFAGVSVSASRAKAAKRAEMDGIRHRTITERILKAV